MVLADIAIYVTDKISSENITLEEYVTTDSLLQNKRGRCNAQNLPPIACNLTHFREGDILVANIRPYLKKIWLADSEGGCSADVLVFRAKEGHSSEYLHAVLLQDAFFSYAMKGAKGSKMPRGDKDQIMRFPIHQVSPSDEPRIGNIIHSLNKKIELNAALNHYLEAMAKQLYDFWFVQFDFPDENGKPYKSSGGKMVWNEKLKREIPEGWSNIPLRDFADIYNGATPSTEVSSNYGGDIIWITPKDLSDQQSKFTYYGYRNITSAGYNSCSTRLLPAKTILLSSRAPIGLISIAMVDLCTNQGFKSLVCKDLQLYAYLYYYIMRHIKQIEQLGTGTTFKEVSREDLCTFPILEVKSTELMQQWFNQVEPVFMQQYELIKEINYLSKIRDELLPLLMNGQISVKQLNNDLAKY